MTTPGDKHLPAPYAGRRAGCTTRGPLVQRVRLALTHSSVGVRILYKELPGVSQAKLSQVRFDSLFLLPLAQSSSRKRPPRCPWSPSTRLARLTRSPPSPTW